MEAREKAAIAIVAACALVAGGLALIPPHGVTRDPVSDTKKFAIGAIALTALAGAFAIAEAISERHFRREAERLRAERAWLAIEDHDGPEGRGLRFEEQGRRVLLLHPIGGLGAPRVIDQPHGLEAALAITGGPDGEPSRGPTM